VIRCGVDVCDSGKDLLAGSCEHSNYLAGFIKGGEFFDWLSAY
jgi:hypothetical protein